METILTIFLAQHVGGSLAAPLAAAILALAGFMLAKVRPSKTVEKSKWEPFKDTGDR